MNPLLILGVVAAGVAAALSASNAKAAPQQSGAVRTINEEFAALQKQNPQLYASAMNVATNGSANDKAAMAQAMRLAGFPLLEKYFQALAYTPPT